MQTKQRRFKEIRIRKRRTAAALRYDPQRDTAPVVLAAGDGLIADKIIALGREHNIPILDDPLLSNALAQVNPGEEIPPELYTLVAEVLAFVYRVYQRRNDLNPQRMRE
jgi:flagellar biosynthesis protein